MQDTLLEQLEKLGLQTNEARIYLAILELGRGSVTEIGKLSNINRTTGYDILERLCLYGIVNRTLLGKKMVYVAEPPHRLKQYLENKKRQAERRLEDVSGVLGDLQSLYKKDSKPVIKFFEGREGIKNIYLHTLESKSVIYSILDLEQYLPEFDEWGEDYISKRVKMGIKEKVLVQKNKKGLDFYQKIYAERKKFQENTEYRWLEQKLNFSPATEVDIYDDKVIGVLLKPGENTAFEIQSESFANSLKIIFELAWAQAEKFAK